MTPAAPYGVYVHIPFCTKRCDYCAFATWTDRFALADRYVTACRTEVEAADLTAATSVFFGGGTPSLLHPEQLHKILGVIRRQPDAEVTVECNPETVDESKLAGYRAAGVTRLSFGVQSMLPHVLEGLGREHRAETVGTATAAAAAAGFAASYSVDLIYGGSGESLGDWEKTLEAVLGLDPPPAHVSAYALTVEPGTPLAIDVARHPEPDDQAEKYLLADAILAGAGFEWYEISNWSRPGSECQHNQLYWDQGEYRGIGCAAHSHAVAPSGMSARRWWNLRTPERYIAAVEAGHPTEAAGESLDSTTRQLEALELSLRTRAGVPADALPGWDTDPNLDDLVDPDPHPGRLVLTPRGRLLANEVTIRLQP